MVMSIGRTLRSRTRDNSKSTPPRASSPAWKRPARPLRVALEGGGGAGEHGRPGATRCRREWRWRECRKARGSATRHAARNPALGSRQARGRPSSAPPARSDPPRGVIRESVYLDLSRAKARIAAPLAERWRAIVDANAFVWDPRSGSSSAPTPRSRASAVPSRRWPY
jgi:hypothetical protein